MFVLEQKFIILALARNKHVFIVSNSIVNSYLCKSYKKLY